MTRLIMPQVSDAVAGLNPGTDPRCDPPILALFQSREATSPWYNAVYDHVEQAMNDFSAATGRQYQPFE